MLFLSFLEFDGTDAEDFSFALNVHSLQLAVLLLVRLDRLERLMKAAFAYLHRSIYILFRTLIFALDVVDLREMSEVAHFDELHLVL